MAESFTKSMARNIYIGGSLFFVLVFLGLAFHTTRTLPSRDNREQLTEQVARGKELWEKNNCIGCHTLLGEGAYFAPELGNVFYRRGNGDTEAFKGFMRVWMSIQPTKAPGRRQMPQFHLTNEEVDDLAAFLEYSSKINTNNWPPNIEG